VICPCPWVITIDFLREHNIHYVAHDDEPYALGSAGAKDIYYDVKRLGMFRATQRTEGISTSDVILRIIKDYDMYVERSLSRGYDRKDIGISATKAFRIKLSAKMNEFKKKFAEEKEKGATLIKTFSNKRRKGEHTLHMVGEMFQNFEYQTE